MVPTAYRCDGFIGRRTIGRSSQLLVPTAIPSRAERDYQPSELRPAIALCVPGQATAFARSLRGVPPRCIAHAQQAIDSSSFCWDDRRMEPKPPLRDRVWFKRVVTFVLGFLTVAIAVLVILSHL